jgi:hypothetical protein
MASSTKIGSMVPSQLVEAVTEHLPDRLPHLSEAAGSVVDEMGGKMGRPVRARKGGAARLVLVGLLVALLTVGFVTYLRNRRSSAAPGSASAPAEDLTLAS